MDVLFWMIGLIALTLVITKALKLLQAKAKTRPADQFSRLLGACFGDNGKAERLIEYEKKKMPWLDRQSAIQMALDRLSKDRGIR